MENAWRTQRYGQRRSKHKKYLYPSNSYLDLVMGIYRFNRLPERMETALDDY